MSVPASYHATCQFTNDGMFLADDNVNSISGTYVFTTTGLRVTESATTAVGYIGTDPVQLAVIEAMRKLTSPGATLEITANGGGSATVTVSDTELTLTKIGPAVSHAPPSATTAATTPTGRPTGTTTASVAACRMTQLSAMFRGGGYGGGNDFSAIWIWNHSARPCHLSGQPAFAAFLADGTPDPQAATNRTATQVSVTLPSGMSAPLHPSNISAGYLVAYLMGSERDDLGQPNGVCRSSDEVTPATLQLTIGDLKFTLPNKDATSPTNKTAYGCHGRITLTDVQLYPGS